MVSWPIIFISMFLVIPSLNKTLIHEIPHFTVDALLGMSFVFLVALSLPHVAAFAATYIRWGAIPVAIGAIFLVFFALSFTLGCAATTVGGSGTEISFYLLISNLVFASICAGCQIGVHKRIRELACK